MPAPKIYPDHMAQTESGCSRGRKPNTTDKDPSPRV
jgi:hypothetical protein